MRHVIAVIGGCALAVMLVVIGGILKIRAGGVRSGAVFDLANDVVAIRPIAIPVLPAISIALLGGATAYVLLFWPFSAGLRPSVRACLLTGFGTAAVALTVWAYVIEGRTGDLAEQPGPGIAPWLEGWVQNAGQMSSLHLLIILSFVSLMYPVRTEDRSAMPRRSRADENTPTTTDGAG